MPGKLFISQSDIDAWVTSEKVELRGEILALRDGSGTFRLQAASLFRKVAGGGDDRRKLVGKVKGEDAMNALGAEAYMTSVLFDDAAYDVEPGFLAIPVGELPEGGRRALAALKSASS
jgi:hypothetical protein